MKVLWCIYLANVHFKENRKLNKLTKKAVQVFLGFLQIM